MKFEVLILGSSSATPMFGRHPTAQVVNLNDQLILIDCGEGTQLRLTAMGVKANKIKAIFISHLHGDHYLGLVGLLSSMHLMGRKATLDVYGPAALQEIVELQFKHSQTTIQYPLTFHAVSSDAPQLIREDSVMRVYSFPLDHRVPCTGFRIEEQARPPALRAEKLKQLGIPHAYYHLLKKGVDYTDPAGRVHAWQDLTIPPPPVRSYAFCSDTAATGAYHESIRGVSVLYHEATFLDNMQSRAIETFHSTALQAGKVAAEVGAESLLIGHYSARYRDLQPLLEEAKTVFPQTELALEGQWYPVGSPTSILRHN